MLTASETDAAYARAGIITMPSPLTARHRSMIRFITTQLFSVLFLQKLALGSGTFQINAPLLVMTAGIGWMAITRRINFSVPRLATYLIFVGVCLISQVISGAGAGSMPSFLELMLIYAAMTITTDLSEADYQRCLLDRFVKFMILPALIVLIQYGFQKLTGGPDPLSMDRMLPKSVLLQGFYYSAPYPVWTSSFTRPNGFFFLEPSFISMFTASAAICELSYLRRPLLIGLMMLATVLSFGGTGMTMLVVAAPFLLARENPRIVLLLVTVLVVGLVVASMMDVPLPLISRLNELDNGKASGSERMLTPAVRLFALLLDPHYLLTGTGSGSTGAEDGSPWPMLKLTNEYGLLTMVAFVVFFITAIRSRGNMPLKAAISVVYHFTGGYLFDMEMVYFLMLLSMNEPVRESAPAVIRRSPLRCVVPAVRLSGHGRLPSKLAALSIPLSDHNG
ncbi:hypothetical protein [Rhodopila sp.]|uniref:hypothetical protein n=1 Tax=Rhodopila sp. TaxID=2480087 RepID=UPI003D0F7A54